MRYLPIILFLLGLQACEWQPERISVPGSKRIVTETIVRGDTLRIALPSDEYEVLEMPDSSIVSIVDFVDQNLVLVALNGGVTRIGIEYPSQLVSNEEEVINQLFVQISILTGKPVTQYYGEDFALDLTESFSTSDLAAADSIAYGVVRDDTSLIHNIAVSDSIILNFPEPGTTQLHLSLLNAEGNQIATDNFIVETIIRQRTLAELFTNAGCVNCPAANENLDKLLTVFPDDFTAIRYHVFWTDPKDPMNLYNPTEVEDRRIYYGSSYEAPRLLFNGELMLQYNNYELLASSVQTQSNGSAEVYLSEPKLQFSSDSIHLDYEIQTFAEPLAGVVAWAVLCQDSIYYSGSNGENLHMQTMRDMSYSPPFTLDRSQVLLQGLAKTPDFAMDGTYKLVIFLQQEETGEIFQVRQVKL